LIKSQQKKEQFRKEVALLSLKVNTTLAINKNQPKVSYLNLDDSKRKVIANPLFI